MNILTKTQKIPVPIHDAWDFFSSPENLAVITPSSMEFKILTEIPEKIYDNLLICYRVKPLPGIPLKWTSLIKDVKPPFSFVDEQLKGPYRYWRHLHELREIPEGTEVKDTVHYISLPGIAGKLVDKLIIRRRLNLIFDYRENKLKEIFGEL